MSPPNKRDLSPTTTSKSHTPNNLYDLLQQSILSQKPSIAPYLSMPPKGSIADRMAIYSDAFYARMEESLQTDYPGLAAFLEEEEFAILCLEYVSAFPSTSYTLDHLGQNLSVFLQERPPYQDKPYLAEMAAYEWAQARAYLAADATLLHYEQLAALPLEQWPSLQLDLHASCQVLRMQWNSYSLINAINKGNKRWPKPKKLKVPHAIMVWRRELEIMSLVLNDLEMIIIQAIQNNLSFSAICEQLSQSMPEEEVAPFLVQKLHHWLNGQWFIQPGV